MLIENVANNYKLITTPFTSADVNINQRNFPEILELL